MTRTDSINALAFDLFAQWENARSQGNNVSLDDFCTAYPELLPDVQEIARWVSLAADSSSAEAESGSPQGESLVGVNQHSSGWVELGRGASSIVYQGHDPTFGTKVAYKVLHTQGRLLSSKDVDRLMQRFEREAQILARLKHDGIVRIFKTFVSKGRPVLEMEYLPGGSLAMHTESVRTQGAVGVARFMERVTRAVGFAHDHGIVHRDLKPSNILLDSTGQPCVSDFGVAKFIRLDDADDSTSSPGDDTVPGAAGLTAIGCQPGTKAYMAPEQFDAAFGPISPATDVWALGIILYELINGTRPFAATSASEWKLAVCRGSLPPRRWSTWWKEGRLESIALRCLARDPTKRYLSAFALADALAAVTRPRWRRPALVGGALVLAVAIGTAMDVWVPVALPSQLPATPPSEEEGDDKTLREIEGEIARMAPGQTVTLIPEKGKPKWYRWQSGRRRGVSLTPEGAFSVNAWDIVLLELVRDTQMDRYEIEASICHDKSDYPGEVGLYFARERYKGVKADLYFFTQLTFNAVERVRVHPGMNVKQPPPDNRPELFPHLLPKVEEGLGTELRMNGMWGQPFKPLGARNGVWHDLRIRVTPEGVNATWEGDSSTRKDDSLHLSSSEIAQSVSEAMPQLRRKYPDNPTMEGLLPKFSPRGGLGLYVWSGSASFKSVSIKRLKDGD